MDSLDWLFVVATTGVGAIFGSFFSAVVHRLYTREGGFLTGPSRCPACAHELSARDLIPVVSWALSQGRCRHCGAPVSPVYPLMELSTALIALVASLGLAVSYETPLSVLPGIGAWWWLMGTVFVLVPIAWYDIRHMEIPDEIVRPAALALLVAHVMAWQAGWALPFFGDAQSIYSLPLVGGSSLREALVCSSVILVFFGLQILVPGTLYALRHGRWRALGDLVLSLLVFPLWMLSLVGLAKREEASPESDPLPSWIGFGDLRLAVFMGLAGGMWGVMGVAIAYLVGSVFGIAWLALGRSSVVPFGPFLALGLVFALSWGPVILARIGF